MTGLSEEAFGDIDHTPEVPVHDPLELRERLAQIHASAKAIKRTKAQQLDVKRQEKIKGTAAEPGQLGKRWRESNRASAKPMETLALFRHQSQLVTAVKEYTSIANFFLVGGYGAGKSFTAVALILSIVDWYNGKPPIIVGLGSPTITFWRKTIWVDLEKILITTGSKYSYDQQQNRLQIGTVSFQIVPTEQPSSIFGFNYSAFICDELDELPQDKAIEAHGAISERCRVQLPPVTPEEWHYAMRFKELEQTRILWPEKFDDCSAPEGEQCKRMAHDGVGDSRVRAVSGGNKRSEMCLRHEHEEAREKKGRTPFKVYVTTAQGYRGTYQITEEMREKNEGFVLIRGLTKDNTANSRAYYQTLYNLYNENERMAFLEGKFVNLSSGRVYPDYDGARHEVKREDGKPLFEILPDDTILVGQDINAGHSKATCIVKREKKLYAIRSLSFKSISDAPFILRTHFPTQKIIVYPDASAKEIISGYMKEFREKDIKIMLAAQNPSVLDRIFIQNKLFKTDRMFVFAGQDTRDLQMAMKTRQYDDNGKPEKGKGEKATDHSADSCEYVCFRIVCSDPDFRDLYNLTRSGKIDEENPEGRVYA